MLFLESVEEQHQYVFVSVISELTRSNLQEHF